MFRTLTRPPGRITREPETPIVNARWEAEVHGRVVARAGSPHAWGLADARREVEARCGGVINATHVAIWRECSRV